MRRIALVSILAAITALVAIAPSAGAATRLGQTFPPSLANTCAGPFEWFQTGTASGVSYRAPTAGVLTSWSFHAGTQETVLTLRVFRPAGAANRYQVVADAGAPRTFAAGSGLHTFPIQIPVKAGDFIGIRSEAGACSAETLDPADTFAWRFGTVANVGVTETYDTTGAGFIMDLAAVLEPDCDGDGLGDESQDRNVPCGRTCKGEAVTIVGTEGSDEISGTPGRDVVAGLGGRDAVGGLGGRDLICGGSGKDTLRGGSGKDRLYGGGGNDKLRGGGGKDRCVGGKKNDSAKACESEKSI